MKGESGKMAKYKRANCKLPFSFMPHYGTVLYGLYELFIVICYFQSQFKLFCVVSVYSLLGKNSLRAMLRLFKVLLTILLKTYMFKYHWMINIINFLTTNHIWPIIFLVRFLVSL